MNPADLAREMMALHDELARGFFTHQVALLDRDHARALAALTTYRDHLLAHAADEEALILPRYRELGGDATDAPVRLFLGEHDKLRAFLADFVARVAALCERPDDGALLELLDREATYKNLMLHHDLRERNALYPFLAARLSPAEQRAVLAARAFAGGFG
ncbi:MAG: hemerythrin domain-containing protein [Planctomycetota bacterium]